MEEENADTVRCGGLEIKLHRSPVMGLTCWSAAQPLSDWLVACDGCTSLLELGCGAALCALAFGKARGMKADDVVATDFNEAVLSLARRNADLNGVTMEFRPLDMEREQLQLDGAALVEEFGRFPLVAGSDVIHDAGQISRVLAAADLVLAADGRCLLGMSEPFRGLVPTLCAQAENLGFSVFGPLEAPGGCQLLCLARGEPAWALPAYVMAASEAPPSAAGPPLGKDKAEFFFD